MKIPNKYSKKKISKIGNAIRFLTNNKGESKTKILKMIYLLEELSIKKFGTPFFNISFQVWKFGPVAEPIFIETSSSPSMLSDYIKINHTSTGSIINGKGNFDDFYFSDNDIELLDYVVDNYRNKTANELISITHRTNSPWYNEAQRRGVLTDLLAEKMTNTHYTIDLYELLGSEVPMKKEMYEDYLELNGSPNNEFEHIHSISTYFELYPYKDQDYTIIGKIKQNIFDDIIECFKYNKAVPRGYRRMLSKK